MLDFVSLKILRARSLHKYLSARERIGKGREVAGERCLLDRWQKRTPAPFMWGITSQSDLIIDAVWRPKLKGNTKDEDGAKKERCDAHFLTFLGRQNFSEVFFSFPLHFLPLCSSHGLGQNGIIDVMSDNFHLGPNYHFALFLSRGMLRFSSWSSHEQRYLERFIPQNLRFIFTGVKAIKSLSSETKLAREVLPEFAGRKNKTFLESRREREKCENQILPSWIPESF